jgi:hypothetical protein
LRTLALHHIAAAALITFAGCNKGKDAEPDPTPSDLPVGAVPQLPLACPAGTPELGAAGGQHLDQRPLTWTWDDTAQLAWSGPHYAQLTEDLIGLAATADAGSAPTAFGLFVMDGRTVVDHTGKTSWDGAPTVAPADSAGDSWGTGDTGGAPYAFPGFYLAPTFHGPELAATIALPLNEATRPTPGCLAMVVISEDPAVFDEPGTLSLLSKRSPPTAHKVDLNLIVIEGTTLSEESLDDTVEVMRRLYDEGGALQLDEVRRYTLTLPDGAFMRATGPVVNAMRATLPEGASESAVNVYFIEDFIRSGGTLGFSAGVPGPFGVPHTVSSGVVLSVDAHRVGSGRLDTDVLGSTLAHEVGHQLGLFHTSEAEGQGFDVLDDTPECTADPFDRDADGFVTAEECYTRDGRNFMFWTSGYFRQERLSPDQADMLNRSATAH